jgi:CDP-diacylglycerol--glycerol-3-phosphate 3-phosphatidyltransferase
MQTLFSIPLNIPNILSLYRLVTFPLVLTLAFLKVQDWYATLICINFVTDILDGLIARIFKIQTDIGAKLDSLADDGTYILALTGVYIFKWNDFQPHLVTFFTLLGLYVLSNVVSLAKFRHISSLHLYSGKVLGYITGFSFFALFAFGFQTWLYYLMVAWGIFSLSENIILLLMLPEPRPDTKGLFWFLKSPENPKSPLKTRTNF